MYQLGSEKEVLSGTVEAESVIEKATDAFI
jgi:hypothetical protein